MAIRRFLRWLLVVFVLYGCGLGTWPLVSLCSPYVHGWLYGPAGPDQLGTVYDCQSGLNPEALLRAPVIFADTQSVTVVEYDNALLVVVTTSSGPVSARCEHVPVRIHRRHGQAPSATVPASRLTKWW